jgi:hypothetical protein
MPRYMYPPRPKSKLLPDQLPHEESRGCWWWQHKFNGDRCVAIIEVEASGRRLVTLCNRHGRFHPSTKFPKLRKELSGPKLLLATGTYYFDGELLAGDQSETMVLFDVLFISVPLIGVTQEQRFSLLDEICGNPTEPCEAQIALSVTEHIWLARHGDKDFVQHFNEYIDSPLIEGLVLRRKGSTLDNYGSSEYEVDWQIRCRKPAKNYRF